MRDEMKIQHVAKIMNQADLPYPLNVAMAASWLIINFKGENIKILEMKKVNTLADYFVIADVENPIQAASLADELISYLKIMKVPYRAHEGGRDSNWNLVDFGDVMVSIFLKQSREIYNLEALWSQAPSIAVPQEYYLSTLFSPGPLVTPDEDAVENYL